MSASEQSVHFSSDDDPSSSTAGPVATPEARAKRIRVLLFDVDGVLTNGDITVLPEAGQSLPKTEDLGTASGEMIEAAIRALKAIEVKSFNAHDGLGVSLARLAGIRMGFVTKRRSIAVAVRARDLRIEHVYQGQNHKLDALTKICADEGITPAEVAYVGDDIIDLPVIRIVGLAIATANARPQVKAAAHYVTPLAGGFGAGRDAIDFILNARGVLDSTIEAYLDKENPEAKKADIGVGNM
jgi:3-deoxy-D-manno-octulosonate 8-phosphate phosphatase (KDO 8-P phosphatase)